MFNRLPVELQLITARHCTAVTLYTLRQASRQLCEVVSNCQVDVDINVVVDDETTGPISTEMMKEWHAISVLLTVPMIYDMDDYDEVGPLGAFFLPLNLLDDVQTRLLRFFSARGPALPAPKVRIRWLLLQLPSPVNPAGALGYALSRRPFQVIHCLLVAAPVLPRLPKHLVIKLDKVIM